MEIEITKVERGKDEQKFFGECNYYYKTDKGEISLLHPCLMTFNQFEIYSIEPEEGLFEDVERYDTLEEAEARINYLLK
jgi:hypothetical protein